METAARTVNQSDPRNLDFEALHCLTRLSRPIRARDLCGSLQRLTNVGEAAHFILSNFSVERARDVDWKYAAELLRPRRGMRRCMISPLGRSETCLMPTDCSTTEIDAGFWEKSALDWDETAAQVLSLRPLERFSCSPLR